MSLKKELMNGKIESTLVRVIEKIYIKMIKELSRKFK
jgi:hypothetical protein